MATHVRGRERHPVVDLLIASPLPTRGEVLIYLDDSAQACFRIVVIALNSVRQ